MMLLALIVTVALQAASPTTVETLAKEQMSRADEPFQVVARTPAEWTALWRKHAGDTPAPKVDFAKRSVVAVFLGTRSSSGYSVEITRTREAGGILTIEWQERRPDPGQISAQILTSPVHIAAIPRHAGEIRFKKVEP
jgi:hypothetical protein